MTTEPRALQGLSSEPLLRNYRFDTTIPSSSDAKPVSQARIKIEKERVQAIVALAQSRAGSEVEPTNIGSEDVLLQQRWRRQRGAGSVISPSSHTQSSFNSQPVLERVLRTRALLRDLTLLVRHADAFVVSGEFSEAGVATFTDA